MRIVLTLLVTLLAPLAGATPPSKAREFIVKDNRGAFEVVVAPAYVTVFYLPEPVKKALASNQTDFSISVMENTVTVRPLKSATKTANLNIDTSAMHVSIILRVGTEEDATSQVSFIRAEEKEEFDRRVEDEVERRLAPMRAELEAQQKTVDDAVARRVDAEMARGMLRRYATRSLDGIARTDEHVVVRSKIAVVVGDRHFVWFNMQNRGTSSYRLGNAAVFQAGAEVPSIVFVETTAADKNLVAEVGAGQRMSGILVVKAKAFAVGKAVELRFLDARTGKTLTIDKLRID